MGNTSQSTTIKTPRSRDMLDIFDDRSDVSSYDGQLAHETSIEDWLVHVQNHNLENTGLAGTAVMDDARSVSSKMSGTSKRSTTSSISPKKKTQLQRQPKDPVLQDWVAQRNAGSSPQKMMSFNKFPTTSNSFATSPAQHKNVSPFTLNPSHSLSPSSHQPHKRIAPSSSYSPSQSHKSIVTPLLDTYSASPNPNNSRSVPVSPVNKVVMLKESLLLRPSFSRSHSESSFQRRVSAETKDADSPQYNVSSLSLHVNSSDHHSVSSATSSGSQDGNPNSGLHLELPIKSSSSSLSTGSGDVVGSMMPAPRPSQASQAFYESIMRMEPPEDDDDHSSRGNAFAFEASRPREAAPPTERYLV